MKVRCRFKTPNLECIETGSALWSEPQQHVRAASWNLSWQYVLEMIFPLWERVLGHARANRGFLIFSTAVASIQFTSLADSSKQIPRSQPRSYRRISVVGTIGSGKTTFARKTSKFIGAPHIELDALHWEPNWVEAPNELFLERVKLSLQGDSWVVDGNYHQVRDIVWSRADTVVWLDYPFRTIIARLARRTLRRIRTHEQLWNGNQEHIRGLFARDSVFLWAIRTYRRRRRQYPILLRRPENSHLTVVRLRSPREAADFLSALGQQGDLN